MAIRILILTLASCGVATCAENSTIPAYLAWTVVQETAEQPASEGETSETMDAVQSTQPEPTVPVVDPKPVKAEKESQTNSVEDFRLQIETHQKAVAADTHISDAVRSSRMQILNSASEALLRLSEHKSARKTLRDQIKVFKEQEESVRAKLNVVVESVKPTIDQTTRSETLLNHVKQITIDQLEPQKTELKRLEQQLKFHSERLQQIPGERAKAEERLKMLALESSDSATEDFDSQLRQLLRNIRKLANEAELRKLEAEVERQELGAKIDPINRDLAAREVKRLEQEIELWNKEAKELRQQEVKAEQQIASDAVATAHWTLEPLAQENAALLEEQNRVVQRLQKLKSEAATVSSETESIVSRRTEIQTKIQAAGLSATNGMLLVDLRRNLMTTGASHIRIRQLQSELREINLAKVGLSEKRDALADPMATVRLLIRSDDLESERAKKAIKFVETKRDYLDQLLTDYQSYVLLVSEISECRKKLIDEINGTIAYIDENALWVRNADPVAWSNIRSARQGLNEFFDPEKWSAVANDTGLRVSKRPYETGIATLTLFGLLVINRRVKRKLVTPESAHESST